jgi:hypothetical protein
LHDRILVTGMIVQVLVAFVAAGVCGSSPGPRAGSRRIPEPPGLNWERTVLALPATERRPHALLFATGSIRAHLPPESPSLFTRAAVRPRPDPIWRFVHVERSSGFIFAAASALTS